MMSFSVSSDDGISSLQETCYRSGSPSDWANSGGSSPDNRDSNRSHLKLDLSSSCSSSPSLWSPFTPPESPLKKKPDTSSTSAGFPSSAERSKARLNQSSSIKRVASANKLFRRSKSIPKFGKESEKPEIPKVSTPVGSDVTFRVRRSLFGRHGWIVMASDERLDLKQLNGDVMHKLADKIRDLEFSGKEVPDQITIRIKD